MTATDRQTTLAGEARYEGFGLHTGERCRVVFLPAPPNTGIVFVRTDMPGRPEVKVAAENATYDADQGRRTILRSGNAEVHTVEHLLAAVRCMGIDNLRIEIDAREPGEPGDGSAGPYVELFRSTGIQEQDAPRLYFEMNRFQQLSSGKPGCNQSAEHCLE